jgi:hypothetical protein
MYIVLRHSRGRYQEAILLAAGPGSMRLAIPGREDVLELTLTHGRWTAEDGEAVEIGFMAASADDGPFCYRRPGPDRIDSRAAGALSSKRAAAAAISPW